MLDEEDKKEIERLIDSKITEYILKLPSIISKLVMDSAGKFKMWQKFLNDNNYLKPSDAELIGKIVMDLESEHPGKEYAEILKMADPIVKERLKLISNMDFNKPKKPLDLKYKGELGEL